MFSKLTKFAHISQAKTATTAQAFTKVAKVGWLSTKEMSKTITASAQRGDSFGEAALRAGSSYLMNHAWWGFTDKWSLLQQKQTITPGIFNLEFLGNSVINTAKMAVDLKVDRTLQRIAQDTFEEKFVLDEDGNPTYNEDGTYKTESLGFIGDLTHELKYMAFDKDDWNETWWGMLGTGLSQVGAGGMKSVKMAGGFLKNGAEAKKFYNEIDNTMSKEYGDSWSAAKKTQYDALKSQVGEKAYMKMRDTEIDILVNESLKTDPTFGTRLQKIEAGGVAKAATKFKMLTMQAYTGNIKKSVQQVIKSYEKVNGSESFGQEFVAAAEALIHTRGLVSDDVTKGRADPDWQWDVDVVNLVIAKKAGLSTDMLLNVVTKMEPEQAVKFQEESITTIKNMYAQAQKIAKRDMKTSDTYKTIKLQAKETKMTKGQTKVAVSNATSRATESIFKAIVDIKTNPNVLDTLVKYGLTIDDINNWQADGVGMDGVISSYKTELEQFDKMVKVEDTEEATVTIDTELQSAIRNGSVTAKTIQDEFLNSGDFKVFEAKVNYLPTKLMTEEMKKAQINKESITKVVDNALSLAKSVEDLKLIGEKKLDSLAWKDSVEKTLGAFDKFKSAMGSTEKMETVMKMMGIDEDKINFIKDFASNPEKYDQVASLIEEKQVAAASAKAKEEAEIAAQNKANEPEVRQTTTEKVVEAKKKTADAAQLKIEPEENRTEQGEVIKGPPVMSDDYAKDLFVPTAKDLADATTDATKANELSKSETADSEPVEGKSFDFKMQLLDNDYKDIVLAQMKVSGASHSEQKLIETTIKTITANANSLEGKIVESGNNSTTTINSAIKSLRSILKSGGGSSAEVRAGVLDNIQKMNVFDDSQLKSIYVDPILEEISKDTVMDLRQKYADVYGDVTKFDAMESEADKRKAVRDAYKVYSLNPMTKNLNIKSLQKVVKLIIPGSEEIISILGQRYLGSKKVYVDTAGKLGMMGNTHKVITKGYAGTVDRLPEIKELLRLNKKEITNLNKSKVKMTNFALAKSIADDMEKFGVKTDTELMADMDRAFNNVPKLREGFTDDEILSMKNGSQPIDEFNSKLYDLTVYSGDKKSYAEYKIDPALTTIGWLSKNSTNEYIESKLVDSSGGGMKIEERTELGINWDSISGLNLNVLSDNLIPRLVDKFDSFDNQLKQIDWLKDQITDKEHQLALKTSIYNKGSIGPEGVTKLEGSAFKLATDLFEPYKSTDDDYVSGFYFEPKVFPNETVPNTAKILNEYAEQSLKIMDDNFDNKAAQEFTGTTKTAYDRLMNYVDEQFENEELNTENWKIIMNADVENENAYDVTEVLMEFQESFRNHMSNNIKATAALYDGTGGFDDIKTRALSDGSVVFDVPNEAGQVIPMASKLIVNKINNSYGEGSNEAAIMIDYIRTNELVKNFASLALDNMKTESGLNSKADDANATKHNYWDSKAQSAIIENVMVKAFEAGLSVYEAKNGKMTDTDRADWGASIKEQAAKISKGYVLNAIKEYGESSEFNPSLLEKGMVKSERYGDLSLFSKGGNIYRSMSQGHKLMANYFANEEAAKSKTRSEVFKMIDDLGTKSPESKEYILQVSKEVKSKIENVHENVRSDLDAIRNGDLTRPKSEFYELSKTLKQEGIGLKDILTFDDTDANFALFRSAMSKNGIVLVDSEFTMVSKAGRTTTLDMVKYGTNIVGKVTEDGNIEFQWVGRRTSVKHEDATLYTSNNKFSEWEYDKTRVLDIKQKYIIAADNISAKEMLNTMTGIVTTKTNSELENSKMSNQELLTKAENKYINEMDEFVNGKPTVDENGDSAKANDYTIADQRNLIKRTVTSKVVNQQSDGDAITKMNKTKAAYSFKNISPKVDGYYDKISYSTNAEETSFKLSDSYGELKFEIKQTGLDYAKSVLPTLSPMSDMHANETGIAGYEVKIISEQNEATARTITLTPKDYGYEDINELHYSARKSDASYLAARSSINKIIYSEVIKNSAENTVESRRANLQNAIVSQMVSPKDSDIEAVRSIIENVTAGGLLNTKQVDIIHSISEVLFGGPNRLHELSSDGYYSEQAVRLSQGFSKPGVEKNGYFPQDEQFISKNDKRINAQETRLMSELKNVEAMEADAKRDHSANAVKRSEFYKALSQNKSDQADLRSSVEEQKVLVKDYEYERKDSGGAKEISREERTELRNSIQESEDAIKYNNELADRKQDQSELNRQIKIHESAVKMSEKNPEGYYPEKLSAFKYASLLEELSTRNEQVKDLNKFALSDQEVEQHNNNISSKRSDLEDTITYLITDSELEAANKNIASSTSELKKLAAEAKSINGKLRRTGATSENSNAKKEIISELYRLRLERSALYNAGNQEIFDYVMETLKHNDEYRPGASKPFDENGNVKGYVDYEFNQSEAAARAAEERAKSIEVQDEEAIANLETNRNEVDENWSENKEAFDEDGGEEFNSVGRDFDSENSNGIKIERAVSATFEEAVESLSANGIVLKKSQDIPIDVYGEFFHILNQARSTFRKQHSVGMKNLETGIFRLQQNLAVKKENVVMKVVDNKPTVEALVRFVAANQDLLAIPGKEFKKDSTLTDLHNKIMGSTEYKKKYEDPEADNTNVKISCF